jgi:hypothetical protein
MLSVNNNDKYINLECNNKKIKILIFQNGSYHYM